MSCFNENDERERGVSIDAIDRESAANAPRQNARKRDCPRASDARRSRLEIYLSYLSAFEMKRHDIARISARAFQPEHKNRAKRREKYPSLPRVATSRLASSYLSACKVTHVPNNFPLVISQPKFLRLLVVFDDYSRRVADARSGDDGRSRARRRRVFCGRLRGVLRISDGKRAQRRAARGWLKRKHVFCAFASRV